MTPLASRRDGPAAAPTAGAAASEASDPEGPRSPERELSQAIWRLSQKAQEGSLTFDEALGAIAPAPPLLFCSLLALPFCQPVPTVGLSVPFGLGVAFIGMSILLGREPKVPRWIGTRRIPTQLFPMLLKATARFVAIAERLLRQRAKWMFAPPLGRVWASVLVLNAICLSLPLPVPFSNAFPAVSILAICLGSLKRDGLALFAGLAAFAAAVSFLVFLAFVGVAALR